MQRLLFASLVFLGGCPLLEVQVEISEACVTKGDVAVPGVPVAAGVGAIDQDFAFGDLAEIHDLLATDVSLRFVRAEVHATSGLASLDFVDHAELTIESATLPMVEAYACDGDCLAGGGVALTASAQDNIVAYLQGDELGGHVLLAGTLPTQPWTMEVTVCMAGSLRKTLSP